MKKPLIIILVLFLILIIPIPTGVYKDGGTREYTALTYKIVDWNRLCDGGTYEKTALYPFPLNFLSIDRLWGREERAAKEAIEFTANFFRVSWEDETDYPQTTFLSTRQELLQFCDNCEDADSLPLKKYGEEFFKSQKLILVALSEGSGSTRHEVESITRFDTRYNVNIKRIEAEVGTCDMAKWYAVIETAAPIRSAEDITVLLDGQNPKTQPQYVSHSEFFADISLYLPYNFEIEKAGSDNESGDFSIRFRPKGEEGFVSVKYFADVFGVCGTGLESEEITLGKYKAHKGTYDGKPVWDFINLFDTAGDYVIMNEGADGWLPRYESEVMDALSTLEVGTRAISESRAIEIAKGKIDKEYEHTVAWFSHVDGQWTVKFYNDTDKSATQVYMTAEGKITEPPKKPEKEDFSYEEKSNSDLCGYPTASDFN